VLSPLTVLAHQGGWDEMLMVLIPIAVFGLLLKVANSRAKAAGAARRDDERHNERQDDEVTPD
jgi:hypothetical protein